MAYRKHDGIRLRGRGLAALLLVMLATRPGLAAEPPRITVATKAFTESVILGHLLEQLMADAGARVRLEPALGGTRALWNALEGGEIDVYPEYTGTLLHEIFAGRRLEEGTGLQRLLAERGIGISKPLGFANNYALGMRASEAERFGITRISDLADHDGLRFGFSNEFMDRSDGWPGLRRRYRLRASSARGLEHDLAYRGLAAGDIDVIDLYSTDAEIAYYGLRVLEDDLDYFAEYQAVLLYRVELAEKAPDALAAALRLELAIDADRMRGMNKAVKIDRRRETEVAAEFLGEHFDVETSIAGGDRRRRLWLRTREHLYLVGVSLTAAILVSIPLGIAAARNERLGRYILALVGLIQTVPSLALLVFMIPLLGIGAAPALAALFLYSLLPIVRNTHAGLRSIGSDLLESADAMGLPRNVRLRWIELPMAARSILAGIKTSAVINVGTATLGALIGAGGYGESILTGIRLDDIGLILEGAVPAALLALAVQGVFDLTERVVVPRGLRLPPSVTQGAR